MAHEFNDGKPTNIESVDDIDLSLLKKGTLRLDKSTRVPSPSEWKGMDLEETVLAFGKDANAVYRDSRPTESIQVREYDDYYTIQLDHANPSEGRIVEHYKLDVSPNQKWQLVAGAVIVGATIWGALQG